MVEKREEKSAGNAILRHLHFLVDRMATAARRSRDVIIMFPPSFVEQTTDVARDKGPAWRFCGFAGRPPNFRTDEGRGSSFFPPLSLLSRTPPFTSTTRQLDLAGSSKEGTTSFLLTSLISREKKRKPRWGSVPSILETKHEETNDSVGDTWEIIQSWGKKFVEINVCFDT